MSAPSATLDAPQSSTTSPSTTVLQQQRGTSSTVPRGNSSLHRPLTSADSCATTIPGSPSTYISVTNVTTPSGSVQSRIESTNANSSGTAAVVEFPVDLQYAHLASPSNAGPTGQSQYCRLPSNNNNSATTSNVLPVAGSTPYQDRSSIVVPVTTQDPDPFVVTVRNSPSKIGKSSSSSFISKHSAGGVNSCSNNKTGPRLALYRSNSSLDLLDRDNYYLHHQRASLGTAKLTGAPGGHHHIHSHHQQQHFDRQSSAGVKAHSKGDGTYTGCFTRRKDFGSHGSIDVLPLTGGVVLPSNSGASVGGGNNVTGTPSSGGKNERSSSLGNTTTGHFLSLVTSAMSRDRRGSFDIHDDGCNSGGGSTSSTISKNSSGGTKDTTVKETASPRLSLKFQKLWEHKDKNSGSGTTQHSPTGSSGGGIATADSSKGSTSATTSSGKSSSNSKTDNSIFRKFRTSSSASRNNGNSKSLPEAGKLDTGPLNTMNHTGGDNYEDFKPVTLRQSSAVMEERYRRRVFAHYDCQSVSAKISSAAILRNILAKRRNTTTGASAASLGHRVSTPPSASLNNIAGVAPAVNSSSGGQQLSLNLTGNSNNNGGSGNSGGSNSSENPSLDLVPSDDPDMGDGHSNALVLR